MLDNGLAMGWSLVQGVLPNVLDYESEVKRSFSRMPYAPIGSNRNKTTKQPVDPLIILSPLANHCQVVVNIFVTQII
jgi:hypothetical protein